MVRLSSEICFKIKSARRNLRLSQSVVAAEVGCKQSALSMFEQGQPTKLSEEIVKKLAEKFQIDLDTKAIKDSGEYTTHEYLTSASGFCPNPHCPSNSIYVIDGKRYLLPDRKLADPIGGKFCARCGENLERYCPNCGAHVHDGAVCSVCGEPYIELL